MARGVLRFIAFIAVAYFGVGTMRAQTVSPFRFEFREEPGPYPVGLKVVEQFDRSRKFESATVSNANPVAAQDFRPLQTLAWFPAEKSSQATMTFGDYGDLIRTETSFGKPVAQGKPQSFVDAFMHGTTDLHALAVRDAAMQAGQFPVLIYAPSV